MRSIFIFFISTLLVINLVEAANYEVIVKETGEALVLIRFSSSGFFQIPLQDDVDEVKVKGALYTLENKTLELSIGSTKTAIVLYTTSMITSKKVDIWNFKLELVSSNSTLVLYLPSEAKIISTEPRSFIEEQDYKKLLWNQVSSVEANYSFSTSIESFQEDGGSLEHLQPKTEGLRQNLREESFRKEEPAGTTTAIITATLLFFALAVSLLVILLILRSGSSKSKTNIIRTLPKNEARIVKILLQHRDGMKRSQLEHISGLAKSSLSAALNNLEKKNIIIIDKTYAAHFVKFTDWFKKL